MEEKVQLGRMLVESNFLTEEQLKMALDFQMSVGGKLGAIIVKLGFIEDRTLTDFIAKQEKLTVVNLDELVLPENLVRRIPRKLIERHHIIPIRYHDGVLTVVTSDPYDYEAIEELQLAVDYRIDMHLSPRSQILRAIHDIFYSEEAAGQAKGAEADERAVRANIPPEELHKALIPLLVEKGVITEAELVRKARDLGKAKER